MRRIILDKYDYLDMWAGIYQDTFYYIRPHDSLLYFDYLNNHYDSPMTARFFTNIQDAVSYREDLVEQDRFRPSEVEIMECSFDSLFFEILDLKFDMADHFEEELDFVIEKRLNNGMIVKDSIGNTFSMLN